MPPAANKDFSRNVFINCPFDDKYFSLLRPLLFTIVSLGFNPRIALETSDSGEQRIEKICQLIKSSQYSVHDLSRLKAKKKGEFYRLNMPFELGIDYGSRRFASNRLRNKRYLILEEHAHNYKRALSDISGLDIKPHHNSPIKVVQAVRNWLVETVGLQGVEGPTSLWFKFNDFAADFNARRRSEGFSEDDLDMMPIREYIRFIKTWTRAAFRKP
jgi:hypothetical protein